MSERNGGCACGKVRYRLTSAPMFVHCCHCRWCQRESGGAFALNALIERDRVEILKGEPECVPTPSESGDGQKFFRCPVCKVALWSHYAMVTGDRIAFIRVGTLDDPNQTPPDVHIFTGSAQSWVPLDNDLPVFAAYYDRIAFWPPDSLARFQALLD
ncbi:MAG: GFA family protein [Pseudomonadota bacterium]